MKIAAAIAAITAITVLTANAAELPRPTGPAQVIDGDGLFVDAREIRLFGIDAPEWNQRCHDGQPCGGLAKAYLESLVAGKTIACQGIEWIRGRRGRRLLARCFVEGRDLSAEMVRAGWARPYLKYSREYEGLAPSGWRFDAPWDFRRRKR